MHLGKIFVQMAIPKKVTLPKQPGITDQMQEENFYIALFAV